MDEPFKSPEVERYLRNIVYDGVLTFSGHARIEMTKDNLDETDIINVLKNGYAPIHGADLIKGTWRYRIQTQNICVVVAFRSKRKATVITAWRF